MTNPSADVVERLCALLRRVDKPGYVRHSAHNTHTSNATYINPNGPRAANLLEAQATELASLRANAEAMALQGRFLKPYLVWTCGPESPGCHPTMPSACGAFLDALTAYQESRK